MKKTNGSETGVSEKLRRSKSREVSSRFLSSADAGTNADAGSPLRQKPRSSTDGRKNRSEEELGFMQKLWPSSTPKPMKSNSNAKNETLADYLGSERLKEDVDRKRNEKLENNSIMFLNRQRSCSEFSRFENSKESSKENHKPLFGGSMRYTGKFKFPGRSSTSSSSSSKSSTLDDEPVLPGRFSVDENALRKKSLTRRPDNLSDSHDSDSECSSDIRSATSFNSQNSFGKTFPSASYMSSTASSRSSGIKVASKYSTIPTPKSAENSPKKFNLKNAMKRANSLTSGSLKPNWPGSPVKEEGRGNVAVFSTMKPPTSPSRGKGVGRLVSMGLDLFKGKKSAVGGGGLPSPLGPPAVESMHQLRLMHNGWVQWRYVNARTEGVNWNIGNQAENNLLYATDGLTKLQHSVVQKKLQLEKEKLEMKLHLMKALESWGAMERPHLSALSVTTKCLHAVVCRVPLVEGAKADPQLASIRLRRASDIGASLLLVASEFSPTAEMTVSMLSELAEVAAQEKSLLEECLELFKTISSLEV
ncbi:hypothetical protein LguiB_002416 [Lonicera macranthoides]